MLIDPGVFDDELDAIGRQLDGIGSLDILYTHFDFDHIIDPPISSRTTVQRWGPSEAVKRSKDEILSSWIDGDAQYYIPREHPRVIPECDTWFMSDMDSHIIAGVGVIALKTPGHTIDSMAYIIPSLSIAAVGDMLSDMEPPLCSYGVYAYLSSLRHLDDVLSRAGVQTVVPGHGRPAETTDEWKARLHRDVRYLDEVRRGADEVIRGADLAQVANAIKYCNNAIPAWHQNSHLDNLKIAVEEQSQDL
jgi:glyoxylase-like metal-dependent hydrolase (beta-lactamase superfamily II)